MLSPSCPKKFGRGDGTVYATPEPYDDGACTAMTADMALQALTPEYLVKKSLMTMRITLTLLEKAKNELYKHYQQHYAA